MNQRNNLKKECPHCGTKNEAAATLCEACGEPLLPATAVTEPVAIREQFPQSAAFFARQAKRHARFSLFSFITGLLSLGIFSWFLSLLLLFWPAGVSFVFWLLPTLLFFLIALGGFILGLIGYEHGKRIVRFLGPLFNFLGLLYFGLALYAELYFISGAH